MEKIKFSLFLIFSIFSLTTFSQIRNVTLFPNKVDVTGATVSSAALSGSFSTPYIVGNGAYQPGTSTPYFTIKDFEVYNSSGTWVGDLPHYSETAVEPVYAPGYRRYYNQLSKEMAVVPVPGSCGRFYVIYIGYELYRTMVMTAIVNATNPASVYIESTTDCRLYPAGGFIPGQSGNIAVTRKKGNGNYDLYVLWRDHFKVFEITSGGINYSDFFTPPNMPLFALSNELELSPNEGYLTFSNGNTVYRGQVNSNNALELTTIASDCIGLEFHSSDNGIVFAADGTGNIKKIDFTSTPTVTNIALPSGLTAYTQLEKDGMGRIYGVLSSVSTDRLYHFPENGTTFTNTNINVYSIASASGGFYLGFSLNEQLDGDDYSTFRGVPALTLNPTINGAGSINPLWNSYYNCNPINLLMNSNGALSRLILVKVDANKVPIVGAEAFSYGSSWLTPSAFNVDLRYLETTEHLLNNSGYYALVIESENACGDATSETFYLQINATPTTASISLMLNDSDPLTPPGVPVSPSHTSPGIAMNTYGGSYNLANSTGDITYRRIQIEQVDNTGSFIRNIVNPAYEEAITGSVSALTALQLNSVPVPAISALGWAGGTGFFVSNGLNNYYKITVTVGNACGSSSDYSYVQLDNSWARMAFLGNTNLTTGASNVVFPNPFENQLTINVPEGEDAKVTISNSMGLLVYEKQFSASKTGSGAVIIETSGLAKGAYIYKLESMGTVISGTVIK